MFEQLLNLAALSGTSLFILIIISLWTLVWKGLALWHSAQAKKKNWFIVMLILNTVGILPIIYLIWFKGKLVKKTTRGKKK